MWKRYAENTMMESFSAIGATYASQKNNKSLDFNREGLATEIDMSLPGPR